MNRNWALITSGPMFEALVGTLIAHEDPAARIFSRSGPDAGQDALSGDGSTVFQAKHFREPKAAKARAAAIDEADKIARYREPGHAHEGKWRHVQRWILVTNAPFNPNDLTLWNETVVPAFQPLGLQVEYWSEGELNAKLDARPEVHRAFFEGETRLFLSLPEVRHSLGQDGSEWAPFIGRDAELASFDAFLASDRRILLVNGPGGVGKSRFLFEAATRAVEDGRVSEALWANLENLSAATAWYNAIVPERDLLVVLDEPRDDRVLRRVLEELRTSQRVSRWKLVVGVRTPNDPVVRSFRSAGKSLAPAEIELLRLPKEMSRELAHQLLDRRIPGLADDDAREGAKVIGNVTEGYPLWIDVAVGLVSDGRPLRELPQDPGGLLDAHFGDVVSNEASDVGKDVVEQTLLWVALFDPLNVEHADELAFVADQCGVTASKLRELLTRLAKRRALTRRGANGRLYELLPRALRDAFLLKKVSYFDDETSRHLATEFGEGLMALLASGFQDRPIPGLAALLARIGNLERIAQGGLDLLSRASAAAVEAATAHRGAAYRKRVLETVTAIGRFRPGCVITVSEHFRTNPSIAEQTSTPIGYVEDTHEDVLLSLAWPVYLAGVLSEQEADKKSVLRELVAIAEAESDCGQPLPNDGRRAKALIPRLIHSQKELLSDYTAAAFSLATERVSALAGEMQLSSSALEATTSLLDAVLAIERVDSWAEEESFTWRRLRLNARGPAALSRSQVRELLWDVVGNPGVAQLNRATAWVVLARAHSEALRARSESIWRLEVEDDLRRTLAFLQFPWPSSMELHRAHDVWEWHLQFDDNNPELKALAAECEAAYLGHARLGEWAWLGSHRYDRDDTATRSDELFSKLSRIETVDALEAMLKDAEEAIRLLPGDKVHRKGIVESVCYKLGYRQGVQGIAATEALKIHRCEPDRAMYRFYSSILRGALSRMRKEEIDPATFVSKLIATTGIGQRTALVHELYLNAGAHDAASFTWGEFEIVSAELGSCLDITTERTWALVGSFFGVSGERVLDVIHGQFPAIPLSRTRDSFVSLVNSLHHRTYIVEPPMIAFGAFEWSRLLALLLYVPDLDHFGGNTEWTLNHLNERFGRPQLAWGIDLLSRRLDRVKQITQPERLSEQRYNALPHDRGFYELLVPCDANTDRPSIERVISWFGRDELADYYLPQCLAHLDGGGALVPSIIKEKLGEAAGRKDRELFLSLAKTAGFYAEDSTQWRTIAQEACRHAQDIVEDPLEVYSQLSWKGIESWSGAAGKLHPRWQDQLERMEARRDDERDAELVPYWEWRVEVARERLKAAKDRHDEEYGR